MHIRKIKIMSQIKKIITVFMITVIGLFTISCQENPSAKENHKEAFKESEGVSQNQFESDINESNNIKFCHRSDYVYESPYIIEEYTITKRQTNISEKVDTIYAELDLKNDYFSTRALGEFKYVFYDVGGWILEKTSVSVSEVTPVREPESDLAMKRFFDDDDYTYSIWYRFSEISDYHEYIYDTFFTDYRFLSLTTDSELYESRLYLKFETDYVKADAMATMIFANNTWKFAFDCEQEPYCNMYPTILSCSEKTEGFFKSFEGTYTHYHIGDGYTIDSTAYAEIDFSDDEVLPMCRIHAVEVHDDYQGKNSIEIDSFYYINPISLQAIPYGSTGRYYDLDAENMTLAGWKKVD